MLSTSYVLDSDLDVGTRKMTDLEMGRAQSGQKEKHMNKPLQQGRLSTRIIGPAGLWGKHSRQRNPGKTWLLGELQSAESWVQWREERGRAAPHAIGDTFPLPSAQGFLLPPQSPGQRGEPNITEIKAVLKGPNILKEMQQLTLQLGSHWHSIVN